MRLPSVPPSALRHPPGPRRLCPARVWGAQVEAKAASSALAAHGGED